MPDRVRRAWWRATVAVIVACLLILWADLTAEPLLPHEQPMFRVDDDPPVYPQTSDT